MCHTITPPFAITVFFISLVRGVRMTSSSSGLSPSYGVHAFLRVVLLSISIIDAPLLQVSSRLVVFDGIEWLT